MRVPTDVLGAGALNNTVNLHQAEIDGKSVSGYLVEILSGEVEEKS